LVPMGRCFSESLKEGRCWLIPAGYAWKSNSTTTTPS
jgi:hypothetical protein